jgi:D-alanyl-D-alanine carboxypeptidase
MRLWTGSSCVVRKFIPSSSARISLIAVVAAAILAGPVAASARVHSSIVVDAQTGAVLEAHNADVRTYPASLTKLMTLYLTFQQLSSGKMTLQQELPVSAHASAQSPTKLWLRPGSDISVRSAILGITTRSANDAAVVLAEAIGGSEEHFAVLMNREARLLGLDHTTFCNASGLPNMRQKTTARDISTLALAILRNDPQYYHFFKDKSFVFRGHRIYGHDHLLGHYPGVDGMKTGYTYASGFNLVTSSVRNGRRLVGVVLGGRTARSRDRLMMALLNRAFLRDDAKTLRASAEGEAQPGRGRSAVRGVADDETEQPSAEASSGEWIVQIGGRFRSQYDVRRALESARHTAPRPLEDAKPVVIRLRGRRYYARFVDLSERAAWETCRLLRRKRFSCKVIHIHPPGVALASAGR